MFEHGADPNNVISYGKLHQKRHIQRFSDQFYPLNPTSSRGLVNKKSKKDFSFFLFWFDFTILRSCFANNEY